MTLRIVYGKSAGTCVKIAVDKEKDDQVYLSLDRKELEYYIGKAPEGDEEIRKLGARICDIAHTYKLKIIEFVQQEYDIKLLVEGVCLKNYQFTNYITDTSKKRVCVEEICIPQELEKEKKAFEELLHITEAIYLARDLVNENAHILNPQEFAARIKTLENECTTVKLLSYEDAKAKGMGLFCAVAKANQDEACLAIVEYMPKENEPAVGFVGKGITYDTGGLNLKPGPGMTGMRADMAGAASVVGLISLAQKQKVQKNIVAIIPLAENLLGEHAYKPGDIYKGLSGKTVEIENTDAEGRLVMADSLTYLQQMYNVSQVNTIATLTGGVIIALGLGVSGLWGDKKRVQKYIEHAEAVGEHAWELPLLDYHKKCLKSTMADFKNTGSVRWGHASQGAAFLSHFVEESISWVHIDIAGSGANLFGAEGDAYTDGLGTGATVRWLYKSLYDV